jgi:FixJ family two-component response regulator
MRGPFPLLLVLVFFNIAGFSLILPLLPFYGTEFNASPFGVACLFAAYSFGNVFGEIFWGRRSDAIGRKPVLILTTEAQHSMMARAKQAGAKAWLIKPVKMAQFVGIVQRFAA